MSHGHIFDAKLPSNIPVIDHETVRVLRRPVIRPDVQLLRLAIVAEGGD